jgi:hypothetical protein
MKTIRLSTRKLRICRIGGLPASPIPRRSIELVSVTLSLWGLELGARLGRRIGDRAEVVGAAVLIAVGIAIATDLL